MMKRLLIAAVAASFFATAALALGQPHGAPKRGATVVEETSNGFTMTLVVARTGKTGWLSLTCPAGRKLGRSTAFAIRAGAFAAERTANGTPLFRFAGRFTIPTQFKGRGSVSADACGANAPSAFSQPGLGQARMTACPKTDPEHPFSSNTPFTFVGKLPGAAKGTHLRIEFTDPNAGNGAPVVVHLTTNALGVFTVVHTFPPSGDTVYGASATPRYPDNPLESTGVPCGFQVR
jgi:hypothetical protein